MRRSDGSRPLVFAHRGASRLAPENTLPAFEAALRSGCDGVELDVQYSSDGALVVFSRLQLESTSDGVGRVSSHTLDELRALDAGSRFGAGWSGTRIPLLDDVLDLLGGRLLLNIQLRAFDWATGGLGIDVVKAVRDRGLAEQVVISSYNPLALRRAQRAGPEIECAILVDPDLPGWTRWDIIRRYSRAAWLQPELPLVDAAFVAWAHRLGMPVAVWTVNEAADALRMQSLKADAIITDDPDRMMQLLEKGGSRPEA